MPSPLPRRCQGVLAALERCVGGEGDRIAAIGRIGRGLRVIRCGPCQGAIQPATLAGVAACRCERVYVRAAEDNVWPVMTGAAVVNPRRSGDSALEALDMVAASVIMIEGGGAW